MVASPEEYRWSSVQASLAITIDPIITPHASYLASGSDPAQRGASYREWLRQGMSDEDLHAIRSHLQQERALGHPRFQAMVEKTLNRPVSLRSRGRSRKTAIDPALA
jgi:putative transposase